VDPPSFLFGQTFFCITLRDVATADTIAGMFRDQSQPQIIGIHLPEAFDSRMYPNLLQLVNNTVYTGVPPGCNRPANITFYSKNGTEFRLFAKSKDWMPPSQDTTQPPKDLYSDYIGPTLGVDLEVETWQTGGESDHDSDGKHTTEDIQWIDLRPLGLNYAWHFRLHDHAKWAVSKDPDTQDETDWVIVADINRVDTQYKRGGVGIAFQNQALAHSLHAIISLAPPPQDVNDHRQRRWLWEAAPGRRACTVRY
jgi:deoxyribonuclease-2